MIDNVELNSLFGSPVRKIEARVEHYKGSALVNSFSYDGNLVSFEIERLSENSKFFGFGVAQKINVKLIDRLRELHFNTDEYFIVKFGNQIVAPKFFITEQHRDEKTNELSITAYDALYLASQINIKGVDFPQPYTIKSFAEDLALLLEDYIEALDLPVLSAFNTSYPEGANIEGTETIRELLTAIAEATQTIYFIDYHNKLKFIRLNSAAEPFTIDKNIYIELDSGDNRRLTALASVSELGDNVEVSLEQIGTTQYIRDNPFWSLREDIDTLLSAALQAVGGFTINQFDCEWRGNPLLEIGDKIALTTRDNQTAVSYLLNDTLSYDGSLTQQSFWSYEDSAESDTNPVSLGDMLKQTYARVDKANKKIDIVASRVEDNANQISGILIDTQSIRGSVSSTQQQLIDISQNVNGQLAELTKKVEATITEDEVNIAISQKLQTEGVTHITTSTGFTFDENGLSISKSNTEMKTLISDDGMTVYRDNEEVLTANNTGVDAINLHATTYLIIGNYSRLEDFDNRTGCFWIGG